MIKCALTVLKACILTGILIVFAASVSAQVQARFIADKTDGCSPLTVNFTNSSTGISANASYQWDFGNGNISTLQHPGAVFTTEKTYSVTLTVMDGGKISSQSLAITVHKKPVIDFTASVTRGCAPLVVKLSSTAQPGDGTPSSWYWDFGDGYTSEQTTPAFQHTYQTEQPATVSLTVKNNYGCHSTLVKQNLIDVLPFIKADFEADQKTLCQVNDPIQFTNKSQGPGTLSYTWDFGNGQISTQKDPSPAFSTKGSYSVKLLVNSSMGCTATQIKTNYVNVDNISVDIQLPTTPVCKNAPVDIKGVCTPLPDKLEWEIDGTPYYSQNPAIQLYYYAPGTHTIKLIATYGACVKTVTRNFTVSDLPALQGFEMKVANVCEAPAAVTVKDTTTGIVKWEWSFNYEAPNIDWTVHATTQSASYTLQGNRSYNIFLRAYNADGCYKDLTKQVNIGYHYAEIIRTNPEKPYGNFLSCGPATVKFKANSQENIVKYKWIFDNNEGTSTDPEPSYTFTANGDHRVRLEFETDKGCKGTAYYLYDITIRSKPVLDFISESGTTICGNSRVNFRTQTPSYYFEYWYIDDVYAGMSSYNMFNYQFTDKGKHTIKVIVDNYGCLDTITKVNYIEVLAPIPKISNVKNSCDERDLVVFSQTSLYGEKWQWDFGDGQQVDLTTDQPAVSHHYASSGSYKVMLTVTNGQCTLKDSSNAYVLLKPTPLLSSPQTVVCGAESFKFTLSNLPGNIYDGYWVPYYMDKWEYGDGTPFTGQNNSFQNFVSPVPYSGELTNFDAGKNQLRVILKESYHGCLDTSNYIPLTVKGSLASYQLLNNDICFNTPLQLKDNSSVGGGSIKKWEWDFGDGQKQSFSQGGTVTHTYASPGSYPVNLKITDDAGCVSGTSQSTQYARVNGPKAAFTASQTVVPLNTNVYFYNTTNDYSYYRATFQWDFGDGKTASGKDVQHIFAATGKFTVTLTATDPVTGCTSTATQEITVGSAKANFTLTHSFIGQDNCIPLLASFSATTVGADSLSWNFGDGTTAGDINTPTHVYDKPGKYIIVLTAYGANGLTVLYKDSVIIAAPQVTLDADTWTGCPGQSVNWNLTGVNTQAFIWDFGDGSTGAAQNGVSTHSYPSPGTYTPTLLMKDANGCLVATAISNRVIIHPNPDVRITPAVAAICLGQPVPITASGADSYVWSPATGLTSAQTANPLAAPTQSSTYQVEGTDVNGCKNKRDITITVHQPFTVKLPAVAALCKGENTSLSASGADSYNWINTTTGLSNLNSGTPTATPAATTAYTVVGYDSYGCFTDTADITVTVNPLPVVNAGKDTAVQSGETVSLFATGSNDILQWRWTPSTYLSCTSCASPVSTPESDMKYTVTGTNQYGCKTADEVIIKLLCDESRISIPNAFTPNGDGKNDLFVVQGISQIRHLVIFNRWGGKVFERSGFNAADPSSCWNGSFNGIAQQTGTYVYFIEMQCPKGSVFAKKGTVVLIR
jgi:gliding motility-associated-like protein